MKLYIPIIIITILLSFCSGFAQQSTADSLIKQLDHLTPVQKVDAYNQLSDIYVNINTKISIEYAEKGLALATEIGYDKGLAGSYGCLGYCYLALDNEKAVNYTTRALEIRTRINDKLGVATSLNVLGILYYYMGNYLVSMDYHMKALKMKEEIGEFNKISASYNNIAIVHIAMGNYESALDYLQRALSLNLKNGRKRNATIVDNIGDVYSKMGKYDKALETFQKSLAMSKEAGYKKSEANCYFNFAKVYYKMKDNQSAFKYYNHALNIYKEINEPNGIANAENGIAALYLEESKTQNALSHALDAYEKAKSINSLENIAASSDIIRKCYSAGGDYKNAYKFLEIYGSTNDSLKNGEKMKRLAKIEFDYKMEKIKKDQESELSRQKIFITALSITLFLSVIIAILIIWAYRHNNKTNAQLSQLNSKLQELITSKDKFFSIIAHDLKSPFQGLMGFSDVLVKEGDELDEKQKKEIFYSLSKLSSDTYKLLENLLQWSNLQTGKIELAPVKFNLSGELYSTIAILTQTARNKNINIENKIEPDLNLTADKNMIQTIIRNLLSNAIKFTRPSGNISISSSQTDTSIEISVKDNGIGMSKRMIENIFKIDSNISTKGTANEEGSGLGLMLCKEMVELHGGKILIESEEGKGSTFKIILPKR